MIKDGIGIKLKKKVFIIVGVCVILLAGAILAVGSTSLRYTAKELIVNSFPALFGYRYYFVNNVKQYNRSEIDFANNDVTEIHVKSGSQYLIKHSRGFAMQFPKTVEFDFSTSQEYFTARDDTLTISVSKELSPYIVTETDPRQYVEQDLHKFLLNPNFIEQNKLTVHKNAYEKVGKFWVQILALSRTPAEGSDIKQNTYVYCYIFTDDTVTGERSGLFYRLLFKAPEYNDELTEEVYKVLRSFTTDIGIIGTSDIYTDFKPIENPNWSDETKQVYSDLKNGEKLKWGVFVHEAVRNVDFDRITNLEEKIDYKFDGLLEYIYFFDDFPLEGMRKARESGKIVELTLQTSTFMQENLDGHNPVFDILDGLHDEDIRTLARGAKDFGHPFFLRLNNEMNSDWTSYGISTCMLDPELFVTLWRRIYNMFEEEGVNNAIWIFNPNDQSFPPHGFNAPFAFYPGDGYVHVFGVTGYNTGTYYAEEFGEKWRGFDEIYDRILENEEKTFGQFPWIITEFASSSVGGDKAGWINNMFETLETDPRYGKIKFAFWFNNADYVDWRDFNNLVVARPYWLDETDETAKAFAGGLKK